VKRVAIALSCFLLAVVARAECPAAEAVGVLRSSSIVRITALQNAKPVEGAVVEVFREPRLYEAHFTLVTDVDGVVTVPKLSPGSYYIAALSAEAKVAELLLDVPEDASESTTDFSMDFAKNYWSSFKTIRATTQTIAAFQGHLDGMGGAFLIGAVIAVYESGSDNKRPVTVIRPDEMGHFSAKLKDGTYVAVVFLEGFRAEIVPVEISMTRGTKEVAIKLAILMC
jgi:hypothetical protein